ncbi:MAG: polysaccharide deacetylase family protein, partial [Candidatus Omnitrophota bacterium]
MKKIFIPIAALLFIIFSIGYVNSLGQGIEDTYASHEIMKWRDNRAAAVSVTFDDGYLSQATTGANLLTARNLQGTFFLVSSAQDTRWENWRQLAEQGHEMASHTVTHLYLTTLSETELRQELSESQETINLNIPTQSCLTFAYPYSDQNEFVQAITSEYYIAGRCTWTGTLNHYPGGPYDPINFFTIGSFCFDNASLEEVEYQLDQSEALNAWFCVHMHGITSEKANRLSQFLDELLTRNIWVDTLGTIVRYMREKIFSTLTILSESSNEITLDLTHPLNNDIYNIPLTIRSTVPLSWDEVEISQDESTFVIEPVIENNEAVVYYDAIPNAGLIILSPYNPSPYPFISVAPSSLSPSTTEGSDPPDQTFNVWNSGGGTLNYFISVSESWLSCSPASGTSTGELDPITVSYS